MYLILHLSLCFLLPTVQPLCPSGFAKLDHGCYKFITASSSVSSANAYCASLDDRAKIVDLETEAEFTNVLDWMVYSMLFLLLYVCLYFLQASQVSHMIKSSYLKGQAQAKII